MCSACWVAFPAANRPLTSNKTRLRLTAGTPCTVLLLLDTRSTMQAVLSSSRVFATRTAIRAARKAVVVQAAARPTW